MARRFGLALLLLGTAPSATASGYYNQTLSRGCAGGVEVSFLLVPGFGHLPRCCSWAADDKGDGEWEGDDGKGKDDCSSFNDETLCTGDDGCAWYEGYGCYTAENEKGNGGGAEGTGSDDKAGGSGGKDDSACQAYESETSCAAEGCTWYETYGCYSGGKRRLQAAGFPSEWDSQATVFDFMRRFTKEISFLTTSEIGEVVTSSTNGCSDAGSGGKRRRMKEGKDSQCGSECALASYAAPRSCIVHANETRCWYTYVPTNTSASNKAGVPLVVDMHGGGGCASYHAMSSGMKELADAHGAVMVWPQSASVEGSGPLWQVAGYDSGSGLDSKVANEMTVDDIGFLKKLISATVAAEADIIDSTRVYVSGFSMGCMMSQRFAYDASAFVSAVGCHGGPLIGGAETAPEGLEPTPIMVVVGTEDTAWAPGARQGAELFASYFQCETTDTTVIAVGDTDGPIDTPSAAPVSAPVVSAPVSAPVVSAPVTRDQENNDDEVNTVSDTLDSGTSQISHTFASTFFWLHMIATFRCAFSNV